MSQLDKRFIKDNAIDSTKLDKSYSFTMKGLTIGPTGQLAVQNSIPVATFGVSSDGDVFCNNLRAKSITSDGDETNFGNIIIEQGNPDSTWTLEAGVLIPGDFQIRQAGDPVGALYFDGDQNLLKINSVLQDTSVSGDIKITGDASATRNLWIGNDASVMRNLWVGNDASVARDASIVRNLNIGNDASISHNLNVGNKITVNGPDGADAIQVSSSIGLFHITPYSDHFELSSEGEVGGNGGHLKIKTFFGADMTLAPDGLLQVNSNISNFSGKINVNNDASVARDASIVKNLWVGQDTSVSRDASVLRNLWVGQDASVIRDASIVKNLWVGKNVQIMGSTFMTPDASQLGLDVIAKGDYIAGISSTIPVNGGTGGVSFVGSALNPDGICFFGIADGTGGYFSAVDCGIYAQSTNGPAGYLNGDASITRNLWVGNDASIVRNLNASNAVITDMTSDYYFNKSLFSTDQMSLAQLEGGAYFGRVGIKENQWDVTGVGDSTWVQRDTSQYWTGVAMSSNGKIQVAAVVDSDWIYESINYGVDWVKISVARAPSEYYSGIAMSSDGKFQVAAMKTSQLRVSADYGASWNTKATSQIWQAVAMSSDGKIQAAVIYGGGIHKSTDYGLTWAATGASSKNWNGIAMSSDGKIITAVEQGSGGNGNIYVSKDYGVTWGSRATALTWQAVAMSSDGKIQVAAVYTGYIFTSTDYGSTWIQRATSQSWKSVSMSSDGKIQVANIYGGNVYISIDYGINWTLKAFSDWWHGIAMSSDGKIITGVVSRDGVSSGYIYTSYATSAISGDTSCSGNLYANHIFSNDTTSGTFDLSFPADYFTTDQTVLASWVKNIPVNGIPYVHLSAPRLKSSYVGKSKDHLLYSNALLPTGIRPSIDSTVKMPIMVFNDSSQHAGFIQLTQDGNIYFAPDLLNGSYIKKTLANYFINTGTGDKGFEAFTVTYPIV